MKKSNNWRGDPTLKSYAAAFFEEARNAVAVSPAGIEGGRFRFIKGILFAIDSELRAKEQELVSWCISLLDAKAGNEKEISELAWECTWQSLVESSVSKNLDDIVTAFIGELLQYSTRSFEFVAPNHIIEFAGDIRALTIGPVKAMYSEDFLKEFIEKVKYKYVDFEIGPGFDFSISGQNVVIQMPLICWSVNVTAAKANVEEEAAWQINIALTLLRLSYPEDRYHLSPYWNDVEDMPLVKSKHSTGGIIANSDGMSGGGITAPRIYVVDEKIKAMSEACRFKSQANAIFFSNQAKSLAKRFGQGLGWLTRGRQTEDRPERFLFFFTAIEALLSSDDKSAPVVQTIARYVSVVLSNDPAERSRAAKVVKKLYSKRSALVHAGQRNITWSDVMDVQALAESIYTRVLNDCNLDQAFSSFQSSLAEASFGLPWMARK